MKKIEILAIKAESFDSETFTGDIKNYEKDSLVALYNRKGLWIEYKPEFVKIKNFYPGSAEKIKNITLRYLLYPLTFFIDHLRVLFLLLNVSIVYGVKNAIVDASDLAVISGVLRKIGLYSKSIYWCGDWFGGNRTRMGIWTNIGGNVVFPMMDYLAYVLNDLTLNISEDIQKARTQYWRHKTLNKQDIFRCRLVIKGNKAQEKRNKILFIGNLRNDSGFDIVLNSLKQIKNKKIEFKLVGGGGYYLDKFKYTVKNLSLENRVNIIGFTERSSFGKVFSDSFCGVNLITSKESYSSKTLPAKIFDYLQFLIPVIVSENLGLISEMIAKYKVGCVISPSVENLIDAVNKVYKNQDIYKKNIHNFLKEYPGENITKYFGNNID